MTVKYRTVKLPQDVYESLRLLVETVAWCGTDAIPAPWQSHVLRDPHGQIVDGRLGLGACARIAVRAMLRAMPVRREQ